MSKFNGDTIDHRRRRKDDKPLKTFEVVDITGRKHLIEAHFVFDNSAEGSGPLIFRRIRDDNSGKTTIAAQFAAGQYSYFKEIEDNV